MKRILIVEDEAIIRMDIKVMLEMAGYEVVAEASNGEKAIEFATRHQPDLILMDIKMPKLDGLKASKIIGQQMDIPILMITAYSQKEFIEKAKQENIVGYLVKPISRNNLLPALELALHQAEKTKKLKMAISDAEDSLTQRKAIEYAKGLVMAHKNLSEVEAYKSMRDTAMTKRIQLYDLAQKIIKKYQT